jgi:UMF1 family MFS transporter
MDASDPKPGDGGWLRRLGLDRRELRSWALYDWANSAFITTVAATVLPIYYKKVAAGALPEAVSTAYWGYTVSVGLLLVTLAAPILGAMADHLGAKKRFLAGFLVLGVTATAGLGLVGPGDWRLASTLYILGSIGFYASVVFSDALLPHIAAPDEVDRVSSAGFALGYVGGGLLLALNAAFIAKPAWFGFADGAAATRVSFVSVSVWWALFSIPIFRNVPEPTVPARSSAGPSPLTAALRRLKHTLGEIRRYRELAKFLIAFWLYSDGIGTIIKMATAYGTEIGIEANDLILALLTVQFVGVPFTFAFGGLAGRIGTQRALYVSLGVYTLIPVFGYWMSETWHFYALAAGVGVVQGGAQALSRSLYATLVPKAKSAEFFSFFSLFEKAAGIAGPIVFGLVGQSTGTSRLGILTLILFFAAGIVVLTRVDVQAGRRAADIE